MLAGLIDQFGEVGAVRTAFEPSAGQGSASST